MKSVDLVVIGAGPAGLMCAWKAASLSRSRVLVLEKNSKPGKKLLVAGSGRCNLTNSAPLETFFRSYGDSGRFVRPCLQNFPPSDLREFFESRGLPLEELNDGKMFPRSGKSSDVLRVLLSACSAENAEIALSERVVSIVRAPGGFIVSTDKAEYGASCVAITTGGSSWPVTGSAGDGFALAAALGHSIVPPRPALAPVFPARYDCASCAGYALEGVHASLWRNGRKAGERRGDALFTHDGLSGPLILDFSRDFAPGDEIRLDLGSLSAHDRPQGESGPCCMDSLLADLCARFPKRTFANAVSSGLALSEALVKVVFSRAGADPSRTGAVLSKAERKAIASVLAEFSFTIERIGDFSVAMATAGGVDVSEANPKTMESRIVPGLHFAGEVLDVDGDTGGFNLQFAFSSGVLAAESAARILASATS